MASRFQFSLRNALLATFWLSVSGASFSFLRTFVHYHPLPPRDWPEWMPEAFVLSLLFLIVWSPFVAAGALFDRPKRGMMIGGVAAILILMLMLFATVHQTNKQFFGPRRALIRSRISPTRLNSAVQPDMAHSEADE